MFQKPNTILKHRVHPFGLLASGLIVLVLLTSLTGMWHYQYELSHTSQPASPASAVGYTATNNKAGGLQNGTQNVAAGSAQANKTNISKSKVASGYRAASTATPANPAGLGSSSPTVVEVSLGVNGSYKGKVTLSSSSNQCDVLSEARRTGLISSLDMRYNSQYKTYAVYVINDIGDSNSVWWTYQVNGKSPPYGCGYTAVHGGDSVNWQYVKG